MSKRWIACGILLLAPASTGSTASERLTMHVTPLVAYAPANLIVQTRVEPSDRNRWIEVVAESDEFYRSSEVQLDGDESPRSSRFEFRDLPGGQYTVAAMLKSPGGVLALKKQDVFVVKHAVAE